MRLKWQWFLGGQIMFWVSTILLFVFISIYIVTFVIDPVAKIHMKEVHMDTSSIKDMSQNYIKDLGVAISKPVVYKFVRYRNEKSSDVLLGTFHEWNNTYYIDVSIDLYNTSVLYDIVKHETRHMVVQELKNKKIIDLSAYTEEIAQEQNDVYNSLFDSSVKILNKSCTPLDIE